MAIDLSRPSAFEREATGVGSVQQLLSGIANIEKKRQDRNTLNQISQARALNPEASLDEIIASISSQGTQFDEGIAGFIQRFASGAGGQGTVLPELQARSITQPTTTLSPAERAKAERVKAGLLPRAGAGKTPAQELSFTLNALEKARGPNFGLTDPSTDQPIPAASPEAAEFLQTQITEILGQLEDKKQNLPKPLADRIDKLSVPGSERLSFRKGKVVQIGTLKLDKPLDLVDARTMRVIGIENTQTIAQAVQDGLFTDEEIESINDGLEKDPGKVDQIIALIESLRSGQQN